MNKRIAGCVLTSVTNSKVIKKMKKLLTFATVLVLTLAFSAVSFAQDAGPQGGQLQGKRKMARGGGMGMMAKFQKEVLATLTLTDVQKSKIADMNKDLAEKIKALRKENKGTEGNKGAGAEVKKIRQSYDKELQTVLGPENWKKYREAMLAKMKEAREKRKESQEKP